MQKNAGINKGAAGTDVIKAGNTVENGARNCGEDKPQKAKQEKVFQIKGCEPSNFVKCDVADKEIHVISTPTATPDVAQKQRTV